MIYSFSDPLANLFGEWASKVTGWSIVLRLVLALLIGFLIGCERSRKRHTAGLRTNILVAVGSAVAMIVNLALAEAGNNTDVARLAAGVITGIGFIGAGAIITNSRAQVTGITTAAALWSSGCLGVAAGAGCYTIAIAGTLIIFLALQLLPSIEHKIKESSRQSNFHIELLTRPDLEKLIDYIRSLGLSVLSIAYDPAYANTGLSVYTIQVYSEAKDRLTCTAIKEKLEKLEYIHYIEII